MSTRTKEQSREYYAKNRDHILARKKAWRIRTGRVTGVGRGHGHHRGDLRHMTEIERKAHHAARIAEWREANHDRVVELRRKWYSEHREHLHRLAWLYRNRNYQKSLERERDYHRRRNDSTRTYPYVPRLSCRIPLYAENAAHARYLMNMAEQRRMDATVPFVTAIQSGLTVGRFSV